MGRFKMKIDLYTKGMLTIIAFALVIIVAKDIVPINKASAHNGLDWVQVRDMIVNYLSDAGYMNETALQIYLRNECSVIDETIYCDHFN